MDAMIWYAFVKSLREEQEALRKEAAPYEAGDARVGRRSMGSAWEDITGKHIAAINAEIASLQRTIDNVITEHGLLNA